MSKNEWKVVLTPTSSFAKLEQPELIGITVAEPENTTNIIPIILGAMLGALIYVLVIS